MEWPLVVIFLFSMAGLLTVGIIHGLLPPAFSWRGNLVAPPFLRSFPYRLDIWRRCRPEKRLLNNVDLTKYCRLIEPLRKLKKDGIWSSLGAFTLQWQGQLSLSSMNTHTIISGLREDRSRSANLMNQFSLWNSKSVEVGYVEDAVCWSRIDSARPAFLQPECLENCQRKKEKIELGCVHKAVAMPLLAPASTPMVKLGLVKIVGAVWPCGPPVGHFVRLPFGWSTGNNREILDIRCLIWQ